ncbi:MAG: nitroreductase family deazaflavin-dependent oxidoreductase [Anaerolineae bacterium]|nr:nitroreductase family deazaflavin-dependent oxidoreductase [Anaerolineae bacterium]
MIKDAVRQFNKYILNHVMRRLAHLRSGPFANVHHVGRKSGKPYETPILVVPIDGGFMIALTYGPKVDWYRNVVAAGGCTLVWHDQPYAIDRVEPVDAAAGRSAFPQPERSILGVIGTHHFARLMGQASAAAR